MQMAKRSKAVIKACFDLLSLVSDEIKGNDIYLFIGVLASQLNPDCYKLFKEAAINGNKISRQNLSTLLEEV